MRVADSCRLFVDLNNAAIELLPSLEHSELMLLVL